MPSASPQGLTYSRRNTSTSGVLGVSAASGSSVRFEPTVDRNRNDQILPQENLLLKVNNIYLPLPQQLAFSYCFPFSYGAKKNTLIIELSYFITFRSILKCMMLKRNAAPLPTFQL